MNMNDMNGNNKENLIKAPTAGPYRLWGMTARMLVDAARIAYAQDPEFDHNRYPGDEEMITDLRKKGRLGSFINSEEMQRSKLS